MGSCRLFHRAGPVIAVVSILFASGALAQQNFQTPEEAAQALVSAIKSDSVKDIRRILGRESDDIIEIR